MKPNPRYHRKPGRFWAHVKYLSEQIGYSERKKRGAPPALKRYTVSDAERLLREACHEDSRIDVDTDLVPEVIQYMNFRTETITNSVEPVLMTRDEARESYHALREEHKPTLPAAMNKQKGEKRHEAYLAGMVQIVAETIFGPDRFVRDAQTLSTIWQDGELKHTFSRRFDGAFPDVRNPAAVWEIKEYYGTTTFGSRVADGVYETLLDGYEISSAQEDLEVDIKHFLFIDDRFTWWECGRSYLCRMVDMLHSGHVDEIFFGRDVISDWPETARRIANGSQLA